MLTRLTRATRLRAGKLLALIYMLCVLAPSLAFAFSDGSHAAPCLTEDEHAMGIVHVHDNADRTAGHVHADGHVHDHSSSAQTMGDHEGQGGPAKSVSDSDTAADHHKTSGGQCCGMVCVSALPATVAELTGPSRLTSRCEPARYPGIADNLPHTLYRPPNS